jgi:ribosomal-protein-alanine N-acetyltransferase
MTVRLRPAMPADVPALARIEREAFSDPWDARAFLTLLDTPAVHVTVAERHGELLGYSVVTLVLDEAELSNLAVTGAARGTGLGRLLLEEALRAVRSHGASTVFLEVRESNTVARALYAAAGFVPVGRRPGYYSRPDEDAVVMRWTGAADGVGTVGGAME